MNVYSEDNFLKEKTKLNSLNSFIVIEYIKSTVDILVDFKVNKQIQSFFDNYNFNENAKNAKNSQNADALGGKKTENDLKILKNKLNESEKYIENLQHKCEDMEISKNEYKKSCANLHEVNKNLKNIFFLNIFLLNIYFSHKLSHKFIFNIFTSNFSQLFHNYFTVIF